jgi:hypothetical protein
MQMTRKHRPVVGEVEGVAEVGVELGELVGVELPLSVPAALPAAHCCSRGRDLAPATRRTKATCTIGPTCQDGFARSAQCQRMAPVPTADDCGICPSAAPDRYRNPSPPSRESIAAIAKPVPTYQLKVALRDTSPPIWRRVTVPADTSLGCLHDIVQVCFGWNDSHLHAFAEPGSGRQFVYFDAPLDRDPGRYVTALPSWHQWTRRSAEAIGGTWRAAAARSARGARETGRTGTYSSPHWAAWPSKNSSCGPRTPD